MIRILHVLGRLDCGGAETLVMNWYRNINRDAIQFDFVIHTEEECYYSAEIRRLGGRIFSVPKYSGFNHATYISKWKAFFLEHPEYKIIHGHVRSTAAIYLKIAKKMGLITIAHSHSTSNGIGTYALVKAILQYPIRYTADYLFACSESAGIWLFGKTACKKGNFFVLKNAIDAKKYIYNEKIRKEKRKEFNIDNKLIIGHIGRFIASKNHIFLIDIFKVLHDNNNDVILMLIGDGALRPLIEKKATDLGLAKSVIFTGVRSDIPDLLQMIDVFVLPSLYEGVPVTLVEAQASGVRCVISDAITKEVIITDMIRRIPLTKSSKDWAMAIMDELAFPFRSNTYEKIVKEKYDVIETVQWLQKFYLEIVNNNCDL